MKRFHISIVKMLRITAVYRLMLLQEELPLRIQHFLHRWLGLYVAFANPGNALAKIAYNDGEPVSITDLHRLARAHDALNYSVNVPIDKCVWGYGWRYTPEENPFSRFYKDDAILEKFYDKYRPTSLEEALMLESPVPRDSMSTLFFSEISLVGPMPALRGHGLSKDAGYQMSGPVSRELLLLEQYRLRHIMASISASGWNPDGFSGNIRGFFLTYGDDYVFILNSGRHRAAALSHLGWQHLPVVFHPFGTRLVRVEDQPDKETLKLYFDVALRQKRRAFLDALCGSKGTPQGWVEEA